MEIIPAINCPDSKCVREKLSFINSQLPDVNWVHIDIADGKFTSIQTWNKPEEFVRFLEIEFSNSNFETNIKRQNPLNIEVHLMVNNPEQYADQWLRAGAKRIIAHLETLRNKDNELSKILEKCSAYDAEMMLALNPETPVEEIFPYLDSLLFAHFLAVKPGPSGQQFDGRVLEKIKVLRERLPDIQIEVDGGMNPETAKKVKEAGADIIVSASYIFNSKNPQKNYQDLFEAVNLP